MSFSEKWINDFLSSIKGNDEKTQYETNEEVFDFLEDNFSDLYRINADGTLMDLDLFMDSFKFDTSYLFCDISNHSISVYQRSVGNSLYYVIMYSPTQTSLKIFEIIQPDEGDYDTLLMLGNVDNRRETIKTLDRFCDNSFEKDYDVELYAFDGTILKRSFEYVI